MGGRVAGVRCEAVGAGDGQHLDVDGAGLRSAVAAARAVAPVVKTSSIRSRDWPVTEGEAVKASATLRARSASESPT